MADEKNGTRRRYSAEFKSQVLAECDAPGVSVAQVAMAHGMNDNVVHTWRKLARERSTKPVKASEFVPVTMSPAPLRCVDERGIEVEVRRGSVSMKIMWPLSAVADFSVWIRELLR